MSSKSERTQATVQNHLREFFRQSIDGVVRDYADDATMIVPAGPLHGPNEIREFFRAFIQGAPPGFMQAFELQRQEFAGEVGYIVWAASPWVHFATDTFVVRDGKIAMQTFAAHPPRW